MIPIFQVVGDGNDITSQLSDRLVEISITDNAGLKNDRLSIVIDDGPFEGGAAIEFPPSGTKYIVSLGYASSDGQEIPCPLMPVGEFTQDELSCSKDEGGRKIHLTAHAVDQEGSFKTVRTRSYHNMKLGDIVGECAKRSNLEPVIEKEFGEIHVDHIDQTNESDGAFLTRLYDDYGAIAKPYRGKLLFGSPENVRTMVGEDSGVVPITEESCASWDFTDQGRGKFTGVQAAYHDKDTGKTHLEKSDRSKSREETYYTLPKTYSNKINARQAAKAKKRAFKKGECSFVFVTIGNPQLIAGAKVILVDFREGIPTEWRLVKVDHKFSKSGFITQCDCETESQGKSEGGSSGASGGSSSEGSGLPSLTQEEESQELPEPDLPALGSIDAGDATEEEGDPNTILKKVFGE